MNRTVKVTGFSLQSNICQKLSDLFCRVGQVQKVYLSPDKNAAFIQFEYRGAVDFALDQKWSYGREVMKVRPLLPTHRDCYPAILATEVPINNQSIDSKLHTESRPYSYSDYQKMSSNLWFEHFSAAPSRPKKKKRKCGFDPCYVAAPQAGKHQGKLKRKTKKKKKCAYLELAAALPFGVTPSIAKDTRQVFLKGWKTVPLSIPTTATAKDLLLLVAEATKVTSEYLHVTAESHVLTDEVVQNIQDGSTLHCTVKGLGGADSDAVHEEMRKKAEQLKNDGNEKYKEQNYEAAIAYYSSSIAMFPLVTAYNNRAMCFIMQSKWEESIKDCDQVLQREPNNMKALLRRGSARKSKGDYRLAESDLMTVHAQGPPTLSQQASSLLKDMQASRPATNEETTAEQELSRSARKRLKKKAKKAGQNKSQEVKEETAADDNTADALGIKEVSEADNLKSSARQANENARERPKLVTDKEAASLSTQPLSGSGGQRVTPSSSSEDVMHWLQTTCGLAQNYHHHLREMDGEVLFDYGNNVCMLVDNTKIPVGVARKIIFLRDNPSFQSKMMKWDVQKVNEFISKFMEGQDLSKVEENHIDGGAFLSYKTKDDIAKDFKVKKLIAFQILVAKQTFLDEEKEGKACAEFGSGGQKHLPSKTTDERFCDPHDMDTKCVELKEDDQFSAYKLYLQNKLQLQPLDTFSEAHCLTSCELRVIYHKRKDLNELEKQFMFLILCKPDFCKGESAKIHSAKLWNFIKDNLSSYWIQTLPAESSRKFSFKGDTILLDGKVLAFGNQPPKLSSIIEFETVRKLDECPTPVMVVDRQLLVKDSVGYTLPLKANKTTSCPFPFRFLEDVKYWLFDSSELGWGFERKILDTSVLGTSPRFQYTDRSRTSTERHDASVDEWENSENQCPPCIKDHDEESPGQAFGSDPVAPLSSVNNISISDASEEFDKEESVTEPATKRSGTDHPAENDMCADTKFICPRTFKRGTWKYSQGMLRSVESGDNMLSRAVEFKFQASCFPEDHVALRSFLYKSLEFVCACLNSRKNGTIYFGVAERKVKEQIFNYGEIHGLEMDLKICAEYYDAFYKYLQKCFSSCFENVKRCLTGPVFINIRNTGRYVIEIDVEPEYEETRELLFHFDPKPVFQKYGCPAKAEKTALEKKKEKHVYLRNQDKWTGIFRRDGSQTKYLDESEKHLFERTVLPDLCRKRKQKELEKAQACKVDMNSPESEKLKEFIGECDSSMFPILLIPKLSEEEKRKSIDFFEFIHYIRWSAVFDFDNDSDKNGIYSIAKSTNLAFEVHESIANDFQDMSVEDRKDSISFPKKTVWLFTNGKTTGSNAFPRLDQKKWKNLYWTFIRNAVAFYKDNSVIPPQRRLVLILVAEEISDGILEAARDIKTDFGWGSVFFVFQSESVRQTFVDELSDDLNDHSVVMPWQHVHYLICQCLNLKSQDEDKYVCTSSGAIVPIPLNEWQSWSDLAVLSVEECKKEWDAYTLSQRNFRGQEEEKQFYEGKHVSWLNFLFTDYHCNHVMERTICSKLISHIEDKIKSTEKDSDLSVPIVTLSHMPGAGGTTLGKAVLWKLKGRHKCALLKNITSDTERQVIQFWESVEEGQDRTCLFPVVLLADNLASEMSELNESELSRKLYRRQKEMQLARPLAIIIHCNRTMKLEGRFKLDQKLTTQEQVWMEKKSEELEKQHPEGVGTFIAFLAMRHGFDEKLLQDTIIQYLDQNVLQENEQEVIEYVSLITTYFPSSRGSPGLPVTSFDGLMRNFKDETAKSLPWEKTLSKIARVVLIIEYCHDSFRNIVRVANQPYARAVLQTALKKNCETLGDMVIKCLKSPLVSGSLRSSKEVTEILTQMIIERQVEVESTGLTHMSPLIMEIKETDLNKAVSVLEAGYRTLGNVVFYQQLARLYMHVNKLDEAQKFAQLAVQLLPEKRDFKHTLGVVYLKKFRDMKQKYTANKGSISEPLKVANLALKNFIEARGNMDDDALSICFAYAQTIETVNTILFFLLDLMPVESAFTLGRYLTEDDYGDCVLLKDLQGTERQALKELLKEGIKALRFMFYLAYSNSLSTSRASFQLSKDERTLEYVTTMCERQMKTLATCVGKMRLNTLSTSPFENTPREDNYLRFKNVKLKGCFFESIFLHVGSLHSSKNEKKRKEIKQRLLEIKTNLESIKEKSFTDMDNLITVYLAREIIGEECSFSSNKSKIYGICNRIIQSDLEHSDTCYMRAHLYRVLVSWPQKYWEGFLLEEFTRSFQHKSPPLWQKKEPLATKIHFYVTKESRSRTVLHSQFCHWTELYDDAKKESPPVDLMNKRLKLFTGNYKFRKNRDGEQLSSIEMQWKCAAGELNLTVWKIRGEKVFREEQVEFYLGFSLRGPVAIIHRVLAGE